MRAGALGCLAAAAGAHRAHTMSPCPLRPPQFDPNDIIEVHMRAGGGSSNGVAGRASGTLGMWCRVPGAGGTPAASHCSRAPRGCSRPPLHALPGPQLQVYVRATGGEVGAASSLAPKIGPLGLSPKKVRPPPGLGPLLLLLFAAGQLVGAGGSKGGRSRGFGQCRQLDRRRRQQRAERRWLMANWL